MERERTGAPQPEEAVSGARSPAELAPLIAEAQAAVGDVRQEAAERIVDLLIALRAPGNEAAEAKAILAALDVSQLNGLVDGKGRDCRKEAVETLLACGFPHALAVNPADLEHARRVPSVAPAQANAAHPLVKLGGWVALFGAAAQLYGALNLFTYWPAMASILALTAALTGAGGIQLSKLKAKEPLSPAFGLLGLGVIVQGGLSVLGFGVMPWTLAGFTAVSAALAAFGHAQPTRGSDGT